jgi:hypothetical protein
MASSLTGKGCYSTRPCPCAVWLSDVKLFSINIHETQSVGFEASPCPYTIYLVVVKHTKAPTHGLERGKHRPAAWQVGFILNLQPRSNIPSTTTNYNPPTYTNSIYQPINKSKENGRPISSLSPPPNPTLHTTIPVPAPTFKPNRDNPKPNKRPAPKRSPSSLHRNLTLSGHKPRSPPARPSNEHPIQRLSIGPTTSRTSREYAAVGAAECAMAWACR